MLPLSNLISRDPAFQEALGLPMYEACYIDLIFYTTIHSLLCYKSRVVMKRQTDVGWWVQPNCMIPACIWSLS